jgi:two-component system sensor histidine kinase ChvG
LVTAGAPGVRPTDGRVKRSIIGIFDSLTVKLIILVGIFIALPFILYGQFEKADRQTRNLLTGSIQHRSWLIAQALTPLLERSTGLADPALSDILAKFTQDETTLRLMLRPETGKNVSGGFYFVASSPPIPSEGLNAELDTLAKHGVLKSLADSCSWGAPIEFRYKQSNGAQELLTSIVPIKTKTACWTLISTHNESEFLDTSIGRPYWQTDGVRIAIAVYLVFAALVILVALSVRRSLRHFREVARDIRRGGVTHATFASRNIIPELASVATDFDHLVHDLRRAAADIRETAEDNAHAVKTPLAIIRSALEPIKRSVPVTDERSRRALHIIDSSLSRLTVLVSAAQRVGNDTADFIEAPKLSLNLTMIVINVLQNARDVALERDVTIIHHLQTDVHVLAPENVLDVVIENILDNAIVFTRPRGTITVSLTRNDKTVDLFIDDEGPGIDPNRISQVFERYVSLRPQQPATLTRSEIDAPSHMGLGLWIVRRHVEALGGHVTALNRETGGLSVHITLPVNAT